MTTLMTALFLSALNLGLIWLLLAAPLGRRTISIRRLIPAEPRRIWGLIGPHAHLEQWNRDVLETRWSDDPVPAMELSYSYPDRHGQPMVRAFAAEVIDQGDDGKAIETRVVNDSALDIGFWRHFSERRLVAPAGDASLVELSQTDRYKGAALLLYRYFCLRTEMMALAGYLRGRPRQKRHPLAYPAMQFGLAIVSTLLLWPFFGLSAKGLTLSIMLTLVIFLHELGHMAAYRAFGHTSVKIMFIPLLGGVAIGSRPYASRFEVATCALMGSGMSAFLVPVITAFDQSAHYRHLPNLLMVFLLILGAFNLLNLLPMHRFDGGQVLRQVLRRPWTQVLASLAVTGILIWIGWRIGIPWPALLCALAVFTLMSLIGSRGPKPKEQLEDISQPQRLLTGFGLFAAITIHGYAVIYACERLFP